MRRLLRNALIGSACLLATAPVTRAADYVAAIAAVKPSIVGIATYADNRSPRLRLVGTGFAVGDGLHVATNAHVVANTLKENERWVVVRAAGQTNAEVRSVLRTIPRLERDIALLRVAEPALPALRLGDSDAVLAGREMAFTGFPLGLIMGLYPVTHRAFVAGIVPFSVPPLRGAQLTAKSIKARRHGNFEVFQLDATAFPGNSGSPLYDPVDHKVYGIINMVLRGGAGTNPAEKPSGITFAVPARHIEELLTAQGLRP